MKFLSVALAALAFFSARLALAADSTVSSGAPAAAASTSSPEASGFDAKFHDDHTITDTALRAREGSMSRFSLRANFSYNGPTVDNLSRTDQPIPDGVVVKTAVGPGGSFGGRLRFDPDTSITLNAGLTDQYLFTTKPSHLDVNDPFVTYDKSFRVGGVQVIASPGATFMTSNVYKKVGAVASVNGGLYSSFNLGSGPFAVGGAIAATYFFFNRDYVSPHALAGASAGGRRPRLPGQAAPVVIVGDVGHVRQVSALVAPEIKYNMTRKINIGTSLGFSFFNAREYDAITKFTSRIMNERLGVGYALTKDIYLYPYLQFYPTQFSWGTTTMNFSTIFSLL